VLADLPLAKLLRLALVNVCISAMPMLQVDRQDVLQLKRRVMTQLGAAYKPAPAPQASCQEHSQGKEQNRDTKNKGRFPLKCSSYSGECEP
jgi:hypothetical protein